MGLGVCAGCALKPVPQGVSPEGDMFAVGLASKVRQIASQCVLEGN